MEQDNSYKLLTSIDTPEDLRKLKAEQLVDVELGYRLNAEKIAFSANLYLMEYIILLTI